MKIEDILKALYFPSSKLVPTPELLARNIVRSIEKDWKIKILILNKQQYSKISFADLKEFEGKSLSGLLKKNSIAIETLPASLSAPLTKAIQELISRHTLVDKQDVFKKIQHHLTKSIAQVLIDNTKTKRTSVTLERTLMTYLPLNLTSSTPKEYYYIPEINYPSCLIRCQKIIKSAATPNFRF